MIKYSDVIKWINRFDGFALRAAQNEFGFNYDDLDKLQDNIIESNDPSLAYFFAVNFSYKTYKMQKIILNNNNPEYYFLFAQNVLNSNIQALQQAVINSKNIKYICKFACHIKNADSKLLESLVLKLNDVKCAYMFLKYINNPNIKKIKKIIFASNKPKYLFELAKHLSNKKEISYIEDLLIKLNSFTYIRYFAKKIKLANISKLEQAILNSKNSDEIKKFAIDVRASKMKKFAALM